jgi:hypothetical protein
MDIRGLEILQMENFIRSKRRKLYIFGKRLMSIPIFSFLKYTSLFTVVSPTIMAVFFEGWRLLDNSDLSFIFAAMKYAILLMIATVILGFSFKFFIWVIGFVIKSFGVPSKITLSRHNNKKYIQIKIENEENESFIGEFKILRINEDALETPLRMGIVRGNNIDLQIVIPENQPVSVGIAYFDEILGCAYFIDFDKSKILLYPQTKIYTQLSGKLDSGDKIIKERWWFINYKIDENGKEFSLSNLIEITGQKIGIGTVNINYSKLKYPFISKILIKIINFLKNL